MIWPLPPLKNECIVLSISPHSLTCGWVSRSLHNKVRLKAYKSHYSDTYITTTIIKKHLREFVECNNLSHSFISIALHNPLVYEEFVRLPYATPTNNDFHTSLLKKMHWDYQYLHSLDNGQHLFYVGGISRESLFTHKLLAYSQNLNLTRITTGYMSLISAYKALFGVTFRKSHLAIALAKSEYILENCMHADSISRLLSIDPELNLDLKQEKLALLTMIGLYFQEREN